MTEKMKKAIRKIDEAMEKDNKLKVFAQYIIDNLIVSDDAAEKILDENKGLKKCFEFVKSKAKEQAIGGCACIEDEQVYSWIKEYFSVFEFHQNNTADKLLEFDILAGI